MARLGLRLLNRFTKRKKRLAGRAPKRKRTRVGTSKAYRSGSASRGARASRKARRVAVAVQANVVPTPIAPLHAAMLDEGQSSAATTKLSAERLLHPDLALRQSIEGFLVDQRSEHTRRAYAKDLKRLYRFLHAKLAEHPGLWVDRSALIAYKESLLAENLQHTTIDRHLATLRSFFQWLVDDGQIAASPAAGVRFLRPERVSKTVGFTNDEVRRVLALPDLHSRSGALHYAVLMTLFYGGMRRSELCALKVSELTEERGQKVLRLRGKGNRERLIVLRPEVFHAITHYFRVNHRVWDGSPVPIFQASRAPGSRGPAKPIDPSLVFYIVKRYAKLAGIQSRVSPHSCRATAISNARDQRVPDRAIQEFAGWSSTAMITRYDKRRTAVDQSATLAINYEDDRQNDRHPPTARGRPNLSGNA